MTIYGLVFSPLWCANIFVQDNYKTKNLFHDHVGHNMPIIHHKNIFQLGFALQFQYL